MKMNEGRGAVASGILRLPSLAAAALAVMALLWPAVLFAGPTSIGPAKPWTSPSPYSCFPPEDLSNCRHDELGPAATLIYNAFDQCAQQFLTASSAIKYVSLAPIAIFYGPPGAVAAGAAAKSELFQDFGKCVTKALIETSDLEPGKKQAMKDAVDTAVELNGIRGLAGNIAKRRNLTEADIQRAADTYVKLKSETAVGLAQRVSGGIDFAGAYRRTVEYVYGPSERAANLLDDYLRLLKECDFEAIPGALDSAKALTDEYCAVAGKQYRLWERNLRCEEERAMMRNDMEWLRQLLPGKQRGMKREKETLVKKLDGLFDGIDEGKRNFEARKKQFEDLKTKYDRTAQSAKAALDRGELKSACDDIVRLGQYEDAEGRNSEGCKKRLGNEFSALGAQLDRAASGIEAEILELAARAEKDLKVCMVDAAKAALDAAESRLPTVWTLRGAVCSNFISASLTEKLKAARQGFNRIRDDAKTARALLEKAASQAQDVCFHDQALTGETAEDRITKLAQSGCLDDTEVNRQLAQIRQAKQKTAQAVADARRNIDKHLRNAYDAVEPKVPRCDGEKAREELAQAEKLYETLACEGLPAPVSQDVDYFSKLARESIRLAREAIGQRIKRFEEAKRYYEEVLSRMARKTDDPCRYGEALNAGDVSLLQRAAAEFCAAERLNQDLSGLRLEVQKLDARVNGDLAALDGAADLVAREPDCAKAQAILDDQKRRIGYLQRCAGHKDRIARALGRMSGAIRQKRASADGQQRNVIKAAEASLSRCEGLEQAVAALRNTSGAIPSSCVSRELGSRAVTLAKRIDAKLGELSAAHGRITALIDEAGAAIKECQYQIARERLNRANRNLPGNPCRQKYQFPALSARIAEQYRYLATHEAYLKDVRRLVTGSLTALQGYLRVRGRTDAEETNRVKQYADHRNTLDANIESVRSAGFEKCIGDLIAAAGRLPKSIQPQLAGAAGLPGRGDGGTVIPPPIGPPGREPPEKKPPVAKPPVTGSTAPAGLPPVKRETDAWVVWYATKIGFQPIYITTKKRFEAKEPSCSYPGGGLDCKVMLEKTFMLGPYPTNDMAKKAACSVMSNFGTMGGIYAGMRVADYQGKKHNIDPIGGCGR